MRRQIAYLQKGIPKLRVGIDAHCLGQRKTGNETYTHSLVKHLSQLQRDGVEYTIYVSSERKADAERYSEEWFRSKRIRPATPLIRIPIGFAIESRVQHLDVLHTQYLLPHHLKCRTVLTVHDVLYERFPEYFTKTDYYRHKLGVPRSCRRADHIITVSQSSKRDLMTLYGLTPQKISVTYLGPESCYHPMDTGEAKEHIREKHGIEGEFLLYVGAIQPRKNIPRLLSAFAKVKCEKRIPHKLVIVGPRSWLAEASFSSLEKNAARKDVIITGYVPSEHLPYFYNAAAAFVYVSMCEGFGLPIVEAMACGTPTITSRGSSLEEIAGDGAVLVDPLDEDAIAGAMESVVSDSDLRGRLRELGLARSREFSCRKMAMQTQDIYRSLMS